MPDDVIVIEQRMNDSGCSTTADRTVEKDRRHRGKYRLCLQQELVTL